MAKHMIARLQSLENELHQAERLAEQTSRSASIIASNYGAPELRRFADNTLEMVRRSRRHLVILKEQVKSGEVPRT